MRTWLLIATACLTLSCTDDPPLDSAPDAGGSNVDAAAPLTHCLDRPDQLPRPPVGRLPCELIPPGLVLGG
jgi:hypothetical protein